MGTFIKEQSLQGHFLVAMPTLQDGFFEGALVYILDHSEDGAIGLVVNQTLNIHTSTLLHEFDNSYDRLKTSALVISGGPVDTHRGFVLHRPSNHKWEGQTGLTEQLSLTNSPDILKAKSLGDDIGEYLIALGYSGWDAGQLEQEITDNHWLSISTEPTAILHLATEQRLDACLGRTWH